VTPDLLRPGAVALPAVHPYLAMDLMSAFEERAERLVDHPYFVWAPFDGEGRTWTYGEFLAAARSTAAGLAGLGVGEGDVVLCHLDNSPAFMLNLLACAHLGAVSLNVNTRYVEDELAHSVELAGAVGMITDPRLGLADGPTASRLGWVVEVDPATGLAVDLDGSPDDAPRCAVDPSRPLSIQMTSGTTSRPKAAVYTHANALWAGQVGARHWGLLPDTRMLVHAPLFHTMAFCWQTMPTTWVGGTIVVQPRYSSSRFWDVVTSTRCTHTTILGPTLQLLQEEDVPPHELRSMTFGYVTRRLAERVGIDLFGTYGMTELVTQVLHSEPGVQEVRGAIGRAAVEYELRVVDEDGDDVEPEETGELLVRGIPGISLFAGYLGDPTATRDAYDDDGYFRTGDRIARHANGGFSFVTRIKDMLKVKGENVAAAEIERVILSVVGVTEVGVVGVPDPVLGEVPVAYVVATGDADLDALRAAIATRCEEQLADFKRPQRLELLDDLPKATLDKIDKGTLRALAERDAAAAST
jgi:crotonobetaine/carnitine-CoA ligase